MPTIDMLIKKAKREEQELKNIYFSYKQEIDKCTLIDLLDELEYQVKRKITTQFTSKDEDVIEECDKKIFILKMRILEINEKNELSKGEL